MERYDVAIIGTGPAGLEAAITATLRNKKVLLIGPDELSTKLLKAKRIDNYLGLPQISGEELAKKFLEHLKSLNIEITKDRITSIYAMGNYFALQGSPEIYEASTIILATGVVPGKMIPGESEHLGMGVSHCATCDAALYRQKDVIVIGYGKQEEAEVTFLSEIAQSVAYFPQYKTDFTTQGNITVYHEKPVSIETEDFLMQLKTEDNTYSAQGIFVLREAIPANQLLMGLETEGPHVLVDRNMTTNIPACFACGDITGKPYQYIKSAGEGNIAALSAVNYLDKNSEQPL
ncbi:MAG: NAD(P)/FAD-dependent oxidoreductase [Coriobacteriales bacterium]|nr:NAD(P)/FAD-dependent oxidoreductase [Coriobacteriales bacterium]